MPKKYTAMVTHDDGWYVAYCPEIPGANGQGRTVEDCVQNLRDAITLILEDEKENGFPPSGD